MNVARNISAHVHVTVHNRHNRKSHLWVMIIHWPSFQVSRWTANLSHFSSPPTLTSLTSPAAETPQDFPVPWPRHWHRLRALQTSMMLYKYLITLRYEWKLNSWRRSYPILRDELARTQDTIMTSFSRPWKPSTVPTSMSQSSRHLRSYTDQRIRAM